MHPNEFRGHSSGFMAGSGLRAGRPRFCVVNGRGRSIA